MSCRPPPFGAHVTKVTAAFLETHSNDETVNILLGRCRALRIRVKVVQFISDHSLLSLVSSCREADKSLMLVNVDDQNVYLTICTLTDECWP